MGVWSYDFVEVQTHDGRKLRLMTLIDEFTRSPPSLWARFTATERRERGAAHRVADQALARRATHRRYDHGHVQKLGNPEGRKN